MQKILFIFFYFNLVFASCQTITTIAGNGTSGFNGDGISALSAELYNPYAMVFDSIGNMFIADDYNHRIRKIDCISGIITTIAGTGTGGYNGDGFLAINAQLYYPNGLAISKNGDLYIADWGNQRVRKIDSNGNIQTVAGTGVSGYSGDNGSATSAKLFGPYGLSFDTNGNLFVSEEINHIIRKVSTIGVITTFAGTGTQGFSGDNGPANIAQLSLPGQTAFDINGNMYIGDEGNNRIRKINPVGIISTVAGTGIQGYSGDNGPATSAELNTPFGVKCDASGNVFFSDGWNNVIRKIDLSSTITTIVGTGFGAGGNCSGGYNGDSIGVNIAKLNNPVGINFDSYGNLFIADLCNSRIRKVTNVTVGITEIKEQNASLNVYPNPTSNSISINIKNNYSLLSSTIIIQNTLGERVKKLLYSKNIDVSDLVEGCYFLILSLKNGETFKTKFIKE